MNNFIKNVHVNKLFHLENFDIPIADAKYPHLIITGKNGSGKTVLLNAITNFLDEIKQDYGYRFWGFEQWIKDYDRELETAKSKREINDIENQKTLLREYYHKLHEKVGLSFTDIRGIMEKYRTGQFVLACYGALRMPQIIEPKNPTKPILSRKNKIKETATDQFLRFLSDLKIQEALARNENQIEDANEIGRWFSEFEDLMRQLFQDNELKIDFNYKDYSFHICSEGNTFRFTEMSDGFAAVLEIVADLILKMQDANSLTRAYEKEGVVLIDEIETHLHLGLQKIIMPLLTKVFPNIQFIVTTHSPFVLSSMDNAVAFDLEHQEAIEDLTDYSYSSLAEGYFGVRTESNTVRMRLNELAALLSKDELSSSEQMDVQLLVRELEKIPEPALPSVVGEYLQLKMKYDDRLKTIFAL
jgi:predicted ATP-binding protein involved in virulence